VTLALYRAYGAHSVKQHQNKISNAVSARQRRMAAIILRYGSDGGGIWLAHGGARLRHRWRIGGGGISSRGVARGAA